MGGVAWRYYSLHQPERDLALSGDQREEFEKLRAEMRRISREGAPGARKVLVDFWTEMAQPGADPTRAAERLEAIFAQRGAVRREQMQTTLKFLAGLDPDQRKRFAEHMIRRTEAMNRNSNVLP